MPAYETSEDYYCVFTQLFEAAKAKTDFFDKLDNNGVILKIVSNTPDTKLTLKPGAIILTGDDADIDADIIVSYESADVAHDFWSKKLKMPLGLATKKIKAEGSVPTILKLVNSFKRLYPIYPELCKKQGIKID